MSSESCRSEVCCPKCNSRMPGICWEKVDGDENPELRNKLLNGTLFTNICTTCNHTFNVLTEFRYRASSDGLYICFTPKHLLQQYNARQITCRQATFQLLRETFRHVHEVNSIEEMISLIKRYTTTPTTTSTERNCQNPDEAQVNTVDEALTNINKNLIELGFDPNDKDILYNTAVSLKEKVAAAGTSPEEIAKAKVDADVAICLLKKASDQNHAEAQYALGCVYTKWGDSTNTYYIEAANCFKRAMRNYSKQHSYGKLMELIDKVRRESENYLFRPPNQSYERGMVLVSQLDDINSNDITDIAKHIEKHKDKYDALQSVLTPKKTVQTNNSNGCFVATAVYGSYEAEEVRVLRQFRDLVLLRHTFTAWTVWVYYKVGPKLASLVSRSPRLRLNTKRLLDRFVSLIDKSMK